MSMLALMAVILLLTEVAESRIVVRRRIVGYRSYGYGGYSYGGYSYGSYYHGRPASPLEAIIGLAVFGCFFCLIVCAACIRARNGHIDDDDFHGETVIEEEVIVEDTPSGNNTAYPEGYQPGDAPPSRPPGF